MLWYVCTTSICRRECYDLLHAVYAHPVRCCAEEAQLCMLQSPVVSSSMIVLRPTLTALMQLPSSMPKVGITYWASQNGCGRTTKNMAYMMTTTDPAASNTD